MMDECVLRGWGDEQVCVGRRLKRRVGVGCCGIDVD
jgi:hypothetical protein